MAELWALLISAQDNPSGIPDSLLDMKREEIIKKKVNTKKKKIAILFHISCYRKKKKKSAKTETGNGKRTANARNRTRRRNTGIGTGLGLGGGRGQDQDLEEGQTRGQAGTMIEPKTRGRGVGPNLGSRMMRQEIMVTRVQMSGRIMAEKNLPNWKVILPILNITCKFNLLKVC
jgi:hypothetical protein